MRVLEADIVVASAGEPALVDGAVAIDRDRIVDVGPATAIAARFPGAARERIADAMILPGFVNAHQHGRGFSQIQLGYRDDALEPWIARRRGRGAPDAYALTRLAAEEMLANGVTATLHANYSYASGDYEAELRGTLKAYEESGLRATVCVGYADRGGLVYPPADETAFRERLSDDARRLIAGARPAYLPLDGTLDLMARLAEEYADHPTIRLAYGPAGPQWVSDAAWRALATDAARRGIGLHFHLLESSAQARCLRQLYPEGVLNRLEALGTFETEVSAAHFTQATAAEVEQAARLGLVIVTNPGSNLRLHNGPPPLAAWRHAGIPLALGTDNCALDDNEDYLSELRLGGLLARLPDASDTTGEAAWTLGMGTTGGARAAFLPEIGCLAPGMKADLVALDLRRLSGAYLDADTRPLDAVMARGCGRDVVLTMVGGVVCFERSGQKALGKTGPAAGTAAASARTARSAGAGAGGQAEEIATALRRHYGTGGV